MAFEMNHEEQSKKHKNSDPEPAPHKKFRKFSGKEFRKHLKSSGKLSALQEFLQNLKENSSQDAALEYFQNGGSLQELLQCLDDVSVPPSIVLDIANNLLLKIMKCGLKYEDEAYQSCRNFLQNSSSVIDKMLGLSSSTVDRLAILKFLTTMATNSSQLSKDILSHVNFNLTRIEFLSICKVENRTVRRHFVYFLTALLIDIEYPVLSLLLNKKGLLTSIIPGLIYDEADTVCFIITAMKNSILLNPLVCKTVKMKTFNTIVVKNIVNLYNWKGPNNLKRANSRGSAIAVDEVEKAKVSQSAHDFLLLLCTSHKYGVIFRDPLVGLGKKTQNALVYTVIDSMDSPWEHSYASELIIKICGACPDVTKYIWNNIKTVLEPRFSSKWLSLVDFIKRLLEELKPSCLESYIKNLTPHQICTVITALVAPIPVLKIIIPENCSYDLQSVKYQVLSLLSSMLKSIVDHLALYKNLLDKEQYDKLKNYLQIYIERNFPTGEILLQNWNTDTKREEDKSFNFLRYLSVIFNIFEHYIELCPDLMSSLGFSQDDLKEFLESVLSRCDHEIDGDKGTLLIQITDVFLTFNPDLFALETDSFNFFLSSLLRICYESAKENNFAANSVLRKLLKNTGIFNDFSDREIDVWINGIFSLKSYNDNISLFITASLKLAKLKIADYMKEFTEHQKSVEDDNCPLLIFNPMAFAVLEYLGTIDEDKSISSYSNSVLSNLIFQSDFRFIPRIVNRINSLNNSVRDHVNSILSSDEISFKFPKALRLFGKETVFNNFLTALNSDSFKSYLKESFSISYPNLPLDLLQMGLFYFSKLTASDDEFRLKYSKNLIIYIKYLIEKKTLNADIILCNSWFIQNFSIIDTELNYCTNFVVDFVECCSTNSLLLDIHMQYVHKKLSKMIFKILKHPKKYDNLEVAKIMDTFHLSFEAHSDVLTKVADYISKNLEKCKFKVFLSILSHCIVKYCQLCEDKSKCLPKEVLENILALYTHLNVEGKIKTFDLSKNLLIYFSEFPESIEYISKDVIESVLSLREYQKANTDFIISILKKRNDLVSCVEEKLDDVLFVKGMLYPVLHLLTDMYLEAEPSKKGWFQDLFLKIFNNLEEILQKTLKKPQKASQHLDNHYFGVCVLVNLYFQKEKFQEYVSKVLKFEVTKTFHAHILNTIFKKFLVSEMDNTSVCNTVMTFVHLLLNTLKRVQKSEDVVEDTLSNVSDVIIDYLKDLSKYKDKYNFRSIQSNDSFKVMVKFLLKYGVSDNEKLLHLLQTFMALIDRDFEDDHIELILDMLISHSGFLDVLLSENHKCKKGILSLMTIICEGWPKFMARSHIPKLLSSYRATVAETDRITFRLIKMYESARDAVSFQDFKPYLWGNDGAIHYSVRIDIGNAILKQPKVKDVLNILQENMVLSTIKYYHLYKSGKDVDNLDASTIYDLEFLIPLFIHLLAPENVVQTYQFARSGALSLALLGLSSQEENMRAATCDLLSRFYFHLEGKQQGKDNFLYMKLITSICLWMSKSDKAMNNFASIFLARTALILSKPSYNNTMLPQLSKYLAVKDILDLSTIPELYTYLGSSDIHYKEHVKFILEILTDGLVLESDFKIFTKSMALKRLMELFSTKTCGKETKLMILDVLIALCRSSMGVKLICVHSSLLQYLLMSLEDDSNCKESDRDLRVKIKLFISKIMLHMNILNKFNHKVIMSITEAIGNS